MRSSSTVPRDSRRGAVPSAGITRTMMDVGAVDMLIWLVLLGVKTLIISGRSLERARMSYLQQTN